MTAFTALLLILAGHNSSAQTQQLPKADNTVHDRMYYLIQKSKEVVLPAEVSRHITVINADNPKNAKAIYSQTTSLKVLYNKLLSKDDKLFFGTQMLKSTSASIIDLRPDIKKLLSRKLDESRVRKAIKSKLKHEKFDLMLFINSRLVFSIK